MEESVTDIGEFGLIRRIEALVGREGSRSEGVVTGIGDDAASFLPKHGFELLITCDSLVENRHYLPANVRSFDIGRRAMTSNISDIGAMGGKPLYALVSLGLKRDTLVRDVEEMYRGFLHELSPFNASVIGGNITQSGNGTFIDITLVGEIEQGKAVRRSGARPGDAILLTGFPGRAAAGLQLLLRGVKSDDALVAAYATPSHRAQAGMALARTGRVSAMTDTSDGFPGDLGHLCEASRVGAEIVRGMIPVDERLRSAAEALGKDPYQFVLGMSDDYELILTCNPRDVQVLQAASGRCGVPLAEVGKITAERQILMLLPDGRRVPLDVSGFDHFSPLR